MTAEAETEVMRPPVKDAQSSQELQETRQRPSLEPSEGARPCQHRDFRLLAFRVLRSTVGPLNLWGLCLQIQLTKDQKH